MSERVRILTVVGARPQFIKASVVSAALARRDDVEEVLVHTGQHYDHGMSKVFFDELGMRPPARHLGIGSGTHGEQTGRMLAAIEQALIEERPQVVLVYGDTNSTLAGALAAAKLHVPVAHVEAGLRSFNRRMPEEINRVVTDHLSTWLFSPTDRATSNLANEGIAGPQVIQCGDVMYDVALYFGRRAGPESRILTSLDVTEGAYVLATIHRAENTDDPLRLQAIMTGLAQAARSRPVVVALHPRTRKMLEQLGLMAGVAGDLRVLEPLGYLDMAALVRHAAVIVTDSGGVQKEAFFHRVPCVTVRTETEWVELVEAGWNRLCDPTDAHAVAAAIAQSLQGERPRHVEPYGKGNAAEMIARTLADHLRA